MCSREGNSERRTTPACNQSEYGCSFASESLISSSSIIRPCSISTKNILPGCNLPLRIIFSGAISKTPTSLARITKSSFVTQNLDGRKPFRSRTAPICFPSVKVTQAGPSHGSISIE